MAVHPSIHMSLHMSLHMSMCVCVLVLVFAVEEARRLLEVLREEPSLVGHGWHDELGGDGEADCVDRSHGPVEGARHPHREHEGVIDTVRGGPFGEADDRCREEIGACDVHDEREQHDERRLPQLQQAHRQSVRGAHLPDLCG